MRTRSVPRGLVGAVVALTASGCISLFDEPPTRSPDGMGPVDVVDRGADPDAMGPDEMGPDAMGPDAMGPDAMGPDAMGPDAVAPDAVAPDAVAPDAEAAPAEACDGLDDDGDGRIDERLDACVVVCPGGEAGRPPPCNGCPQGVEVPAGWVCVPPGIYQRGSPPDAEVLPGYEPDPEEEALLHPQTSVRISRPFLMMAYEVTQGEWQRLAVESTRGGGRPAGSQPSRFPGEHAIDDPCVADVPDPALQLPVERVSWFEAVWHANTRSRLEGLEPCYDEDALADCVGTPGTGCPDDAPRCRADVFDCSADVEAVLADIRPHCRGYRLPTESEWEYAARAGTTTQFWTGDAIDAALEAAAWFVLTSDGRTHPVGCRQPNAWGLHDMPGNVGELCHDRHAPYPNWQAGDPPLVDPLGAPGVGERVSRGASFGSVGASMRSAGRGGGRIQRERSVYAGFRLVRGL